MAEVMFEILLFTAYLSAALISVVMAVYAISVSYLGRETTRSLWSLKRRQSDLANRIRKFQERVDVKEIEKEIEKYHKEESDIKGKLRFLSANGAVFLPLVAFFIALSFSIYGMYQSTWYPQGSNLFTALSLIANGAGIIVLVKVLKTIEWAALRIPQPRFEISYKSGLNEEKMKAQEERELELRISNTGDVMAEDIGVLVLFPPGFKVIKDPSYSVVEQGKESDNPGYIAADFSTKKLHVNTAVQTPLIRIKTPEKLGRYTIPVCIYERNAGECEQELFINIE